MNIITENYQLYNGDCLKIMDYLIEQNIKVDMILCDPPYGTTKCKWDSIIPFDKMWDKLNKLIKSNGVILLFGTEPFSSNLRISNIKKYRYDIIWEKERITNFFFVKKQIAKCHENISIFYEKQPTYNPQMQKIEGKKFWSRSGGTVMNNKLYDQKIVEKDRKSNGDYRFPRSVQKFSMHNVGLYHPTQKPTDLLEFLIKTYTNENELVLDFTMGSGSTGVACMNTNRKFIGIELEENYFNIAIERIFENYNISDNQDSTK